MITFPNAKINLGLNILSKREDGYHNISSCFYPIPVKDALEIIPAQQTSFESTGLKIPGNSDDNLVWKAFQLLKKEFHLPKTAIILHKAIPMGAGIGGGSADGAFMLKLLNDFYKLDLSLEKLEMYALQLGSDCPFFIQNKPKLVTGRGEIFNDIDINLKGYYLGLVFPGIHIGTKEAYSGITPKTPESSVKEVIENHSIDQWKGLLQNDFEKNVFKLHLKLADAKEQLYNSGALYASMTGSGSTMYGIFENEPTSDFIDQTIELN